MNKRTIVVGTGFLGTAVVEELHSSGNRPLNTYRNNRAFSDSIKFDLYRQTLPEVASLSGIETVIITAMVEDIADATCVAAMMRSLLRYTRDKRVIYLSSDAVFDGRTGGYRESAAKSPVTSYGRNKANIEDILMTHSTDYCIVRPSYIFGCSGGRLDSRLTVARKSLRKGVSYVRYADMYKSPTEVNFLARVVAWASQSSFQGILHVGGDRISVFEFFRKALTELGDDTSQLLSGRIPLTAPPELLADTSLDCSLLARVFDESHPSIEQALAAVPDPVKSR